MLLIRDATTADIPLIRELAGKVWPQTYIPIVGEAQVAYMLHQFYTPEALAEQMGVGKQQFIIGNIEDCPVAFASFSQMDDENAKLHKLYILPGLQGQGIGRDLLVHIAGRVRKLAANSLLVNVNRYNAPAISFYEKTGFSQFKEEDIDIGNGYFMNDYVMRLALTE